jgi:hypothetical protein
MSDAKMDDLLGPAINDAEHADDEKAAKDAKMQTTT